jgi:toxin FitB
VANTLAAAADQIFAAYADRIIAIDEAIARCCGRSLGLSDKHMDDTGLAATAEVKGLIIVTRNQADFQGRGVTILNPFKKNRLASFLHSRDATVGAPERVSAPSSSVGCAEE